MYKDRTIMLRKVVVPGDLVGCILVLEAEVLVLGRKMLLLGQKVPRLVPEVPMTGPGRARSRESYHSHEG